MEERKLYEIIYDSLVDMGLTEKYGHPGIYSISIEDKLVYIGKSRDMLHRISSHLANIEQGDEAHKYKILRQAREEGCKINFDVVEYCEQDDDVIGTAEAIHINAHKPPLNYMIPFIDDYKHGKGQKIAKTITLDEILYPEEVFIF